MELLYAVAGITLIFLGLADVFFTVLHFDGFGFVSSRLYNTIFNVVRFLCGPLPRRYRALGLSLAAPMMVPITIMVWISLVATGYALVYYAGMSEQTFAFAPGVRPSLLDALYTSGVSISTLGFGDITPRSGLYQLVSVSEALIGFGILTLAVSYVIGVYGVLTRLGILSAGLHHQTQDTDDPWTILAPHFPNGEVRALESHLMELHRGLVEIYEGIRRYPVVYYYHSRRAYRSLPYTFRTIGGMTGALRWGLPTDHAAPQTPWLPTLTTGIETVISFFERRFFSGPLEEAPDPVPFEAFEDALCDRVRTPSDYFLGRFLEMEAFMRELAHMDDPSEPKEAYARYTEWLPFGHRVHAFFEASAADLGYEMDELAEFPGESLF